MAADTAGGDAQRFLQGRDVPQRWWTSFGNDELSRRVQTALAHSPSIASAQAALRQAQENAPCRSAAICFRPWMQASASPARSTPGSASAPATRRDLHPLQRIDRASSYTLDLFGGVRRGIEAQLAQGDYQQAQLDSTYLTLAGNVVTTSLQEASLREQIHATEQIIDWQRKALDIAKAQQEIGATALTDTLAVRTQFATTDATLPPLRAQLAATRNQLATYMGITPAQLEAAPLTLDTVTLPQDIPVSLPSQLVDQRPDIRATSARLHAASAQVGVATAQMLPQLTLSGSAGSQALRAGDLFSAGTRCLVAGAGPHPAAVPRRPAAAQQACRRSRPGRRGGGLAADRAGGVPERGRCACRRCSSTRRRLSAQATAESAASRRLELARQQYQLGATGYLDLLDAERSYQQARITLIQARTARLSDTAALYTALGGGWRRDGHRGERRHRHVRSIPLNRIHRIQTLKEFAHDHARRQEAQHHQAHDLDDRRRAGADRRDRRHQGVAGDAADSFDAQAGTVGSEHCQGHRAGMATLAQRGRHACVPPTAPTWRWMWPAWSPRST